MEGFAVAFWFDFLFAESSSSPNRWAAFEIPVKLCEKRNHHNRKKLRKKNNKNCIHFIVYLMISLKMRSITQCFGLTDNFFSPSFFKHKTPYLYWLFNFKTILVIIFVFSKDWNSQCVYIVY